MVVARVLVLLCVAIAVVQSKAPDMSVAVDRVSFPPRQLAEEGVTVHVIVHKKGVAPATEPLHKHHKKGEKDKKGVSEVSEIVRNYDHGSVHIMASGVKAAGNAHHEKSAAKRGSAKIFGEKVSAPVDKDTKSTQMSAKKAATKKEQDVTRTANDANELMTKLSRTPSADKNPFHDTFGPMVIICGIIGGLAAIVGVVGLAMDHSQLIKDSLDVADSAELDIDDVEITVTSVGAQDDDSDSDSDNDKDEEEGSFTIGTARVSV